MRSVILSLYRLCVCGLFCVLLNASVLAQDGQEMAEYWCSSCHLFPDPELLDKSTWINNVLPEMGARLGFQTFRDGTYRPSSDTPPGVYADGPLMESAEWDAIVNWYESQSPEQLAIPNWLSREELGLFSAEVPGREEHDFSVSTAVFIDEVAHRILVGDSHESDLEIYGQDLVLLAEVRSAGIVSSIRRLPTGSYLATVIGETIAQTESLHGLLIEISKAAADGGPASVQRLARRLHRPVSVEFGDFNHDGSLDYVIAEFGTYSGQLSLHLSQSDGTLVKTIMLEEAGVTSMSVIGDDLMVLIAQGNERIIRLNGFVNDQVGVAETVLAFPPSQGSSSMSVLDINGDGELDILYTAGDNADISPIFKPYHGIYLFVGQPDGTFVEQMFFHLDGATSAVAADFDQDGDVDIAAIAYYANIDQGLDETGFVYLENDADSFSPKYIAGLGELGRYVALSVGDVDGDGDQDIALANLTFGPDGPLVIPTELRRQWSSGPAFVLLRNGLR